MQIHVSLILIQESKNHQDLENHQCLNYPDLNSWGMILNEPSYSYNGYITNMLCFIAEFIP